MSQESPSTNETFSDRPLRFSLPDRHARGRVVRLGPVLDEILSAHAYPPAIERLLSEALTLAALLGLMLKDERGQLTMQAKTEEGAIDLLVVDYRAGELRGYVKYDAEKLALLPAEPTLYALFGRGYLAVTFDQPGPDGKPTPDTRYQGIVPLEGGCLADAVQYYFVQSEQVPTLIRTAQKKGGGRCLSGGILIQHLPQGEEGRERLHVQQDHPEWEHVQILAETISPEELTDRNLSLETVVWRLFHEEREIRVEQDRPLVRGCRCSSEHIRDVIARFPAEERAEMAVDGVIGVECEFCVRTFPMTLESFAN